MKIQKFTFNYFGENTYVLYDETGECVIIDPGCSNSNEENSLSDFIEKNKLKPVLLLNTHCHIDHILGNAFVKNKYQIPLYINQHDEPVLKAGTSIAQAYGIVYSPSPLPDKFIDENDKINFGNSEFDIAFTPGHSPGSLCFINHDYRKIIGGDVLFNGSIGRTDLPGGDFQTLENSIINKLYTMPDEYVVYCGHGEETTIGFEKYNNPFVRLKT